MHSPPYRYVMVGGGVGARFPLEYSLKNLDSEAKALATCAGRHGIGLAELGDTTVP
jgi:hypothetical protein